MWEGCKAKSWTSSHEKVPVVCLAAGSCGQCGFFFVVAVYITQDLLGWQTMSQSTVDLKSVTRSSARINDSTLNFFYSKLHSEHFKSCLPMASHCCFLVTFRMYNHMSLSRQENGFPDTLRSKSHSEVTQDVVPRYNHRCLYLVSHLHCQC